jgi:3-oxoacyl-[acyl-carrier protein] reductase
MLDDKTAVIYGGGGAIGGAVARAFAAAGARVHLAGRSRDRLTQVAEDIGDAGGAAAADVAVAEVDVLDGDAVAQHADAVAAAEGGIDIALNAASFPFVHGTPFLETPVDEVMRPIDAFLRANLITAQAVGRHMARRGSGTILTLSTGASRFAAAGTLGYGTTGEAIETISQRLAVELGPHGVRVVCLRPHAIADGPSHGSFATDVFASRAAAAGLGVEEWLAQWSQDMTLLGRFPTVAQVADAAVFLASDHAAPITGAVIDLTSGNAVRTDAGFQIALLD